MDHRSAGGNLFTNAIMYIALSDTPVEVGEEDVWMIMENGEWVEAHPQNEVGVVQEQGAEEIPPIIAAIEPPPEIMEEPILLVDEEIPVLVDGEKSTPSSLLRRLWPYGALVLGIIFVVLYFIRKNRTPVSGDSA